MGSQPLDTDQHRQDASRGGSSSGGSPGHKKAKPQGAAELPQGGVSGLEQGGGVEEAEGAAFCCQADHGERSLCKTLDVEQHLKVVSPIRSISNSSLKPRPRSVSRESSS